MNIFQRNAGKIVFLGMFAASMAAIFVRLIDATPIAIGFFRLTFSLPFFAVAVLVGHRKELMAVSRRDLLMSLLTGVLLAGHFFGWFTAIKHTTIASASVLGSTSPILVLFITLVFFHEKTTIKAISGVFVAILGAVIISWGDYSFAGEAIYGDFMALIGSLFLAVYFVAGRQIRMRLNATVYIFLVFFACWASFGVAMLVTATPVLGYSTKDYLLLFAIAIVCQIGAHAVFNWCLGYVKALYLSSVELLEPIIASALAMLLFSEIPSTWQLLGGFVTILGLVYYTKNDTN